MASANHPIKNTAWYIRVPLVNLAANGSYKANPTIAAGDFKVEIDGGAGANLATLPSASPASGIMVLINLSAAEMNGDSIVIKCIDQTSPKEWADLIISINTSAS